MAVTAPRSPEYRSGLDVSISDQVCKKISKPIKHHMQMSHMCLSAVYVVFGAAGGIGSALARRLAGQQGAKVVQVIPHLREV